MNQPETVSIFSYKKDGQLTSRIYDHDFYAQSDEIKEWIDTRAFGYVELAIIKALYKYAFLNIHSLETVLSVMLQPRLQKPKYAKNIDLLYRKGVIVKYTYKTAASELVFYGLMPGAYEYIRTYYKKYPRTHRTVHDPSDVEEVYSIPQILERLSLNQLHINLAVNYRDCIKKEVYYSRMRYYLTRFFFPSVIQIKAKERLTVFSLVCPKDESGMETYLRRLTTLTMALDTNGRDKTLLLIACESIRQIERSYATLTNIHELATLTPIYTIDLHTAHADGLEWLYEFRTGSGDQLSLESYDIHLS